MFDFAFLEGVVVVVVVVVVMVLAFVAFVVSYVLVSRVVFLVILFLSLVVSLASVFSLLLSLPRFVAQDHGLSGCFVGGCGCCCGLLVDRVVCCGVLWCGVYGC